MRLTVKDIPPGEKFILIRAGKKYTMICQHEEKKYLFRVIEHSFTDSRDHHTTNREVTLNGQSYVKLIIRIRT